MAGQLFPRERDDGSFTVAARFTVPNADARDLIRQRVSTWVAGRVEREQVDVLADLSSLPRVEEVDSSTADVVFEGRPGSRLWKGFMVELTQELSDGQAAFVGFWDLVAGKPHPASVRPGNGSPGTG